VPERFSYTSRISFLTWCRFSKRMTAFAESCVCHWFNLVQLSSAHDSFPRRGGSPEADYGGAAGRFCGHHASVGSRNYRSPGAAATAVMSAHEAGAPLQEIMLKRCWILLSPMSQPSSPDFPIGGAEGAARLEVRDGKAVILLSQDIPESAGYVHKAFGLEV
jgi:hypothetical protein